MIFLFVTSTSVCFLPPPDDSFVEILQHFVHFLVQQKSYVDDNDLEILLRAFNNNNKRICCI